MGSRKDWFAMCLPKCAAFPVSLDKIKELSLYFGNEFYFRGQ
jgi:hypothetical protein